MKQLFLELIQIYKTKVRIKQLKRRTIENFSRFFISFIESNQDTKDKKDKYLQLKKSGLNYILDNQDFIYSQINK
jgi:hypothetical protein